MTDSRTHYIVEGDSPEVMQAIAGPDTMGIILHRAWSQEALEFADKIVHVAEFNREGERGVDLGRMLASGRYPGSEAFQENWALIKRLFDAVADSVKPGCKTYDGSRIEPAIGDSTASYNENLHVDCPPVIGLTNPAGLTAEILTEHLQGKFDRTHIFHPKRPEQLESAIKPLPQDAFLLMKGNSYPGLDEEIYQGLPHRRRRPNLLDLPLSTARIVGHLIAG